MRGLSTMSLKHLEPSPFSLGRFHALRTARTPWTRQKRCWRPKLVDVTSTSVGSNEEKIFLFLDMKRSINIYCQCNMQERLDNIQTKPLGPRNPARDGWVSVRENGVFFFSGSDGHCSRVGYQGWMS